MFYDLLEKELKKRNLNLNKLAKGIGVAQSPTSRWKTGTLPNLETFKKICEYLNVSADYLLDLAPQEITEQEKKLLENFRAADQRGKESIIDLADREAMRNKQNENLSTLKIG